MDIKLEGINELAKEFKQIGIDIDDEIDKALEHAAREVMELSQEYVPYDTGNLHDSATYDVQDGAEVGYTADYATQVHERTERPGSKFLERAIDEYTQEYTQAFEDRLKELLNG